MTSAGFFDSTEPCAPDGAQLAGIDLGADADDEDADLRADVVERLHEILARDAMRVVGAVGEDDERAEAQRLRRALHLLRQRRQRLDDRAVQVGRRIARLVVAERVDAALHRAAAAGEADDRMDLLGAVEGVDRDLLRLRHALGESGRGVGEHRRLARVGHRARHVHEQQRVLHRRHFGIEDGLLRLERRDQLAVFVDVELLGGQVGDADVLVVGDVEVDGHVRRLLDAGVDELEVEAAARGDEGKQQ